MVNIRSKSVFDKKLKTNQFNFKPINFALKGTSIEKDQIELNAKVENIEKFSKELSLKKSDQKKVTIDKINQNSEKDTRNRFTYGSSKEHCLEKIKTRTLINAKFTNIKLIKLKQTTSNVQESIKISDFSENVVLNPFYELFSKICSDFNNRKVKVFRWIGEEKITSQKINDINEKRSEGMNNFKHILCEKVQNSKKVEENVDFPTMKKQIKKFLTFSENKKVDKNRLKNKVLEKFVKCSLKVIIINRLKSKLKLIKAGIQNQQKNLLSEKRIKTEFFEENVQKCIKNDICFNITEEKLSNEPIHVESDCLNRLFPIFFTSQNIEIEDDLPSVPIFKRNFLELSQYEQTNEFSTICLIFSNEFSINVKKGAFNETCFLNEFVDEQTFDNFNCSQEMSLTQEITAKSSEIDIRQILNVKKIDEKIIKNLILNDKITKFNYLLPSKLNETIMNDRIFRPLIKFRDPLILDSNDNIEKQFEEFYFNSRGKHFSRLFTGWMTDVKDIVSCRLVENGFKIFNDLEKDINEPTFDDKFCFGQQNDDFFKKLEKLNLNSEKDNFQSRFYFEKKGKTFLQIENETEKMNILRLKDSKLKENDFKELFSVICNDKQLISTGLSFFKKILSRKRTSKAEYSIS